MNIETFIEAMPKVELHAHLNGSLSNKSLKMLHNLNAQTKGQTPFVDPNFYQIIASDAHDLSLCFQKFKYAHDLTNTRNSLKLATLAVIEDFADDNVMYLELRTTPKSNAGMSKRTYLEAVLEAIIDARSQHPNILVKLLPSIDRSKGVAENDESICIVLDLLAQHKDIIVGIDLSGDPLKGDFKDSLPILEKARKSHLKLALHCGEVKNDTEILEMLEFGMDRLGHGTFLDDAHFERGGILDQKRIPVECCLTSNVKCGTVSTYDDHHFLPMFRRNYPVVVCTDDFGVFNTSLSKELKLCAKTYNLTLSDMVRLTRNAIESSFATHDERYMMTARLGRFIETTTI